VISGNDWLQMDRNTEIRRLVGGSYQHTHYHICWVKVLEGTEEITDSRQSGVTQEVRR